MTKLTTYYDDTDQVWYAYEGNAQDDSRALGQGTTPEDAKADFWYQVNGEAAELSHDEESGWWYLKQGYHAIGFGTREAAIAYADNHEWQAKSL